MEVRGSSGGQESRGPKSEGGAPNAQHIRHEMKLESDECE